MIAQRTHDVADAYLPATQKVPVRLRLGALTAACGKAWNSACFGSTRAPVQIRPRRLSCGGTRAGTGRRLLTALTQVRFLPPQLTTIRKGKPTGDGSRLESGRAAMPWEFDSPSFRLRALGRAAKAPAFQAGEASSTLAGHSRGSANGRLPGFEPGDGGSSPSPRTSLAMAVSQEHMIRGSCCW